MAAAPSPNLGLAVALEARWHSFSVSLGGRADLPAGTSVEGGSLSTALLVGELVPCWRLDWLGLCLVSQLGAETAQPQNIPGGFQSTGLYAALGPRAVADYPLASWLSLRLALELLAPLVRSNVIAQGVTVFTSPPVSADLSAGVVVRLL